MFCFLTIKVTRRKDLTNLSLNSILVGICGLVNCSFVGFWWTSSLLKGQFHELFVSHFRRFSSFLSNHFTGCAPRIWQVFRAGKLYFLQAKLFFKDILIIINFSSLVFLLIRKVIWRSFFGKSHKFQKSAKITKAKIFSVSELAKIFKKVFSSKQTFKMWKNLETPKKLPDKKFQNSY